MKEVKHNLISVIENDILELISSLFLKSTRKKLFIKKGEFYNFFVKSYPLKYQKNNKYTIDSDLILEVVKSLDLCSKFKFRKRSVNRYKFLKYKVKRYEKALLLQRDKR
ncbi:MAG: hypothetical protein GQ564_13860 [Bacteroidales bacterium]|nr:hypothetical protein [Bacteroidales bacterium]